MKVILLKSVPKVGKKDDVVEVNEGYAANALFPKKLAIPATDAGIAAIKIRAQHKVVEQQVQHNLLDRAIAALEGRALVYTVKANDKGHLFSKVDAADISAELLKQYRIAIDVRQLSIAGAPIKQIGVYTVSVSDGGYSTTFSVEIRAQ